MNTELLLIDDLLPKDKDLIQSYNCNATHVIFDSDHNGITTLYEGTWCIIVLSYASNEMVRGYD